MFYAAEALLVDRDQRFSKHGGVHAAFGKEFASRQVLDPKFHRWLLDAFDKRIQSDYGVDATITGLDVKTMIEQAREFVEVARTYLAGRNRDLEGPPAEG